MPDPRPATHRLRRDAQENRERVLRQAALVFAEHGLGVTLADLAKVAGVGVGTLYRGFADKDELILAVYQDKMDGGITKARTASEAADPGAAFQAFIEAGAEDFASDRGFRELVLGGLTESLGWSRSGPPTALTRAVDQMNTSVRGHLAVLLERAKAAGALRHDVEPTDVQLVNTAVQSVSSFASGARPGIQHRMISMLLEGLRPRADARPIATPPLTEEELTKAVRRTAPRRP
jgi:AcrR family transcriptional regulator